MIMPEKVFSVKKEILKIEVNGLTFHLLPVTVHKEDT